MAMPQKQMDTEISIQKWGAAVTKTQNTQHQLWEWMGSRAVQAAMKPFTKPLKMARKWLQNVQKNGSLLWNGRTIVKMDSYGNMEDKNWLVDIGKVISSENFESGSWLHLAVYDKLTKERQELKWTMTNLQSEFRQNIKGQEFAGLENKIDFLLQTLQLEKRFSK